MSAAVPLPKPGGEPGGEAGPDGGRSRGDDAEGWALLDALRRKLDDQAAQTRRTQDQVTQLADSIAALVAAGRRRSRWLNLNSFVAYVIFTVLLAAGSLLLYRSRADELVEARDHAIGERDAAVKRADDAVAKVSARDQAEAKAWELYQWIEQGKRGDVVAKLAALRDLPLSRIERAALADRTQQSQVLEVDTALKAAAAAFKANKHAEVIAPLEAALRIEPPTTMRAAQMHFYLGVAYAKAGELDKAIAHLQPAVNADVEPDEARFQLAAALDRGGAYAKARAEYDRFATARPQSPQAVFAMRRSATLARMPAVAPTTAPKLPPAAAQPPAAPKLAPAPNAAAPAPAPNTAAPAPKLTAPPPKPSSPPNPTAPPSSPSMTSPAAPGATTPSTTPPASPNATPPPSPKRTPDPPPTKAPTLVDPFGQPQSQADELPPPAKDPDHRNRPLRPRPIEPPAPKPDPSPEPPSVPLPSPPSSPPRAQSDDNEIVGDPAPSPPRVTSR